MRILTTSVCALAILGLAASASAENRRPMVVVSAEVSATGTTLFVSGERFGRAPEVRVGGMLLGGVVVNASGTHLTANLPAFPPGSYKLEVTRVYSWQRNDDDVSRLTVAIGAMGPRGETGSMGHKGDPGVAGPSGPAGPKGDPGSSVSGGGGVAGLRCPAGVSLLGFTPSGGLLCSTCGNGVLDSADEFEPAPGPFASAPVNANTCRFDFSRVTQLYCNNGCSVAGPSGCDQADADLLCKLRTGNPASVASEFAVDFALAEPGFSCPGYGQEVNVIGRGVNVPMYFTEDSLATHGAGLSVTNVVCTP